MAPPVTTRSALRVARRGRIRDQRRGRGEGKVGVGRGPGSKGFRVACCCIGAFGFPASALAQIAYGGVPNGIGAVSNGFTIPGLNAPLAASAPPQEAPGGPAWKLTPGIEIGEAYNDNVSLAPKGSEVADFITTISPSLTLSGDTARTHVYLVYDPQALLFARGTFGNELQQRLLGLSNTAVLPQLLFFDARASIDQEFVTSTGPIGQSTLTTSNNLQTVETTSASPYLLYRFGRYVNSESRYTFSTVSTSDNTIASEQIHELRQRLVSGDYFQRLAWAFTADATEINRLSGSLDPLAGTTSKDQYAKVDLRYPLPFLTSLSLTGSGGYERISDPFFNPSPHGPIWSGGFGYQPTPYFAAFASYGRRFDQTDVEASAAYTPNPDLQLRGLYSLSFQTGQSFIASSLNEAAVGPNGTLIDARTGLPFVAVNNATPGLPSSAFGIPSGAFFEKRFQVDATTTRERNSYSVSAYDVKISGDQRFITNERIFGATLGWGRQLRPGLRLDTGATFYRALFENGSSEQDNSYALSLKLTYTISPTASASLSVSRIDTSSNVPSSALVNDVALISLRKQF